MEASSFFNRTLVVVYRRSTDKEKEAYDELYNFIKNNSLINKNNINDIIDSYNVEHKKNFPTEGD